MAHLGDVFAGPAELLGIEPEELAGVLLEVIPSVTQRGMFVWQNFTEQVFPPGGGGWPRSGFSDVAQAIAEALNWLMSQGLVIYEPEQTGEWMRLTRRAQSIKTKVDWQAYRKGGALPVALLQPHLAEKVHHLFVRGDHDIAVFQAFKEVEVGVRTACGYSDALVGRALMQKAFAIHDGPLRNMEIIASEREAEVFLFAGAIGHAKNPTSHRDVALDRDEAARLIVFASHLLAIVETRPLR
ncbi:MAG: TIGR02391 family protein [Sphingomonas sp.]|nr:TIGR02391 family protein [Sphingomonas sp.]